MKYFWKISLIAIMSITAKIADCAQVWPCPGACINAESNFPDLEKGVILFDLGLPQTERPSVYGLSVAFWRSNYRELMLGAQVGLLENRAADMYGGQLGIANSAGRGVGVQFGLINEYDDVSFRIQAGLWNSHRLSLNWNYGRPSHSGGCGVQFALVNMSSEGWHFQFGLLNFADASTVFQIGVYNNIDKKSRGLQIGLINEVDADGIPFVRLHW